jgi:hypothetical protein
MIIQLTLAILCFLIALSLLFFIPFIIGAPFDPSRKKAVEKILFLATPKKGDVSVDLGSGDGRLVLAFAHRGIEAHGFEINPFLVLYSKYKAKKLKLKNAHFHWKNFWKSDLSKFNIVTIFQIGYIMPKLEKKLLSELPKGAKIISNTWKFPNLTPKKIDDKIRLYVKE